MNTSKTWFITGASQGIGLELAKQALVKGDNVVGTSRNSSKLKMALPNGNSNFLAVDMDIKNETSVASAVSNALNQFGKIEMQDMVYLAELKNHQVEKFRQILILMYLVS